MGEIEANDEKLDEALLQFPGAGSSPWGSIWSSSELKSSWTQETPFDAAAEIVRQLVLRQRPELETVLDTVLSDLHGKCPQGHVSEQVEKGSSAMSDRLQELQEQKASLLQHLRDVAEEANSHKRGVPNNSFWGFF
ncbi:hypothetical protein KFL_006960050 [Klebsormidium nitens]|uniref:Uncharacterized protein n=1 Tax=Klebsormidium nitens TaxID=105231 RepID=A0A1Y1IN43_KLENI|nr:hypothetical protein KFL_006960050 [Klebsormidium nitens]|eukprot:GAQ90879.1 hypothetical protein KFL_006960050 [Klebsormidium nitens]